MKFECQITWNIWDILMPKKIICCLSGIPMLLGILYFSCCCWMWHISLHMSKGVPSVEGQERKCGWHSCTGVNTVNNYWHVLWGPFRSLSKAMRLVRSFLWKPCCSSWTCNPAWCWQPRQHLLIPLYPLCSFSFTLRFFMNLGPAPLSGGGKSQGGYFFGLKGWV